MFLNERIKIGIITVLYLLFSLPAFSQDLNQFISECNKTWPNIINLQIDKTSYYLLIEPSLIFNQEIISGNVVTIKNGESTPWFIKTIKDSKEIISGIQYDGRNRSIYLGFANNERTFMNYGIFGEVICIPGNGFIYTYGTNREYKEPFSIVNKFSYNGDKYKIMPQAFRYINKKSNINQNFDIFSDYEMSNKVATVNKGSIVTIIGINGISEFNTDKPLKVLISTPLGLIGWMLDRTINSQSLIDTRILEFFTHFSGGSS